MSCKGGGGEAMREKYATKKLGKTMNYREGYTIPTFTHTHHTPVTFDAVVVKCFCHGGQSLVPRVTIGDQLEKTDRRSVTLIHVTLMTGFYGLFSS